MKIEREELNLLRDESRKEFINLDANSCLIGEFKALDMSDRVALSWLSAAISVLNKKGLLRRQLDDAHLRIDLHQPDSTTMTDGYDPEVDSEAKAA